MSVAQSWFANTLVAGPSESEKQAYYTTSLEAARNGTYQGREIKPGVEILPGWRPWDGLGVTDGWQIASLMLKTTNGDINSICPGDWFQATTSDAAKTTYTYVCQGRDQYYVEGGKTNGIHHYTFVPDRLYPIAMSYNQNTGSNDWSTSMLKTWLESSFINFLPATLQQVIGNLAIPFTDYKGVRSAPLSKIFPPSEIEAFGGVRYSREIRGTVTGFGQANNPYTILSRSDQTRARNTDWYWLRSSMFGSAGVVPCVNQAGDQDRYDASSKGSVLPCFNII